MRHLKRFTAGLALGVLTTLAAGEALAQSGLVQKSVAVSLTRTVNQKLVQRDAYISGACGAGVACAHRDTSEAIYVGDWYWGIARGAVARPIIGNDTSFVLGTLYMTAQGTAGADTVTVWRDVSADGLNWTTPDSASASLAAGSNLSQDASDSTTTIMTAVPVPATPSSTSRSGAITYRASPWMPSGGVTRLSTTDVQYVRFRVRMTTGDGALSGAGVQLRWQYPALGALSTLSQ